MSKTISDIYSGMFKKHTTEYAVKQQEQLEQQTSKETVNESSIISAFAKKAKVVDESKLNTTALAASLSFIKESIESNPTLAISELDKVINNLKK